MVGAACETAYAGRPVLADPRRLAADALRAGAAGELAPCGWWSAPSTARTSPGPRSGPCPT
ncbi:hypothetical protein ACFQX7_22495 [Luedemannella flava]